MNSIPLNTGNKIQIKEYNTRPLLFLKFVIQKMVISHIHVHVYLFDTVQYISVQLISSLELKLATILKYQADTGYNDSSKLPILYLFYHMYTTYITNLIKVI
jgi:hypothetical protein